MTLYTLGKYDFKELYGFEELPKGAMFSLSMNPYTGRVFCKFEKHDASSHIALELMRQIVRECAAMFPDSKDPLRDFAAFADRRAELEKMQLLEQMKEKARRHEKEGEVVLTVGTAQGSGR